MIEKIAKVLSASGILLALTIGHVDQPVLAAGKNANMTMAKYHHVVRVSGDLRMLPQKLLTHLMLVANGIEPEANLRDLRAARDRFEQTAKALRSGDPELRLPATTNQEILAQLDVVESVWRHLDALVRGSIASGKVLDGHVYQAAALTTSLTAALDKAVETYQTKSLDGRMISANAVNINFSTREAMLAQKMLFELLRIAYGHEVEQNSKDLKKTISLFQDVLKALIHGDPELHLVPAPTGQIDAQLKRVELIWEEFMPLVEEVVRSGRADPETVEKLSQTDLALLRELDTVVWLYETL